MSQTQSSTITSVPAVWRKSTTRQRQRSALTWFTECWWSVCLLGNSPIAHLQALLAKPKFFNLFDYQFERNSRPGVIEDIHDGELYRSHFEQENSLLHNKHNLLFTYNTDRVPLFKSSKFSLWPLYFAVNELPCQQRFQREKIILAGLWCGERKPLMLNFLKPFHTALSKLETDGVETKCPS